MPGKSFVFRFGDVEVRAREFTLIKAGEVLAVEPKAFRVLLILLRNPQKLIAKEELLNAVWGDAAVTENSLTRSIALLRKLLGDESRSPRYIETVATVGYRFVCKVEVSEEASGILEPTGQPPVNRKEAEAGANEPARGNEVAVGETNGGKLNSGGRQRLRKWLIVCVGSLALALAAVFWYLHRPLPPPRISAYTQITRDGQNKYLVGTDGSRLYINQRSPQSVTQVSIAGGEIVPVQVSVPGFFVHLDDVSSDGSSLLVESQEKGTSTFTLWNVHTLGGSFRRLAPDMYTAAFSPDGNSVVYLSPEGDIWLVRSDGTGAHKLASTGSERGWWPTWSPDGTTIRFLRDNGIWEISSNGSNLHQLLPEWHKEGYQSWGRWTPDGKFYVFQSASSPSETAQLWALDERRGLFRRPPAEPIQLTSGAVFWDNPVPSRDGKKIFANGTNHRGELFRLDLRTKQFQSFLGGISAEDVSFSKDGQSVAYVSYPQGILWRANRDGSNPVQLTDPPISAFLPRWSPDGTQVLFTDENANVICEISSQGGSVRRLLHDDDRTEGDPNWSPDGKKVVFGSGHRVYPDPKGDIRILDLDSHQVTTIPGSVGLFSPRWSPDGQFIAALPFDNRGMKIFDVAAQRWSALPDKEGIEYPTWSRDSKMIYYLRLGGEGGLFRIHVMGGEAERIHDMKDWHSTGSGWMGLDPTDAPLMLRDIGSSDVYALTLEEK